jgi:ADP-ribosylglycohydrolase
MSQPLAADHAARLERARLTLDGLSVGDAFGAQFFLGPVYQTHFAARTTPPGPWRYTDDTVMALGIVEVLERRGQIDPDELAAVFARRYQADIHRDYGPNIYTLLGAVARGTPWRTASYGAFRGKGSLGNGGAMRVAPLGAYFADDLDAVVAQAELSAVVTHAHPEGVAGAVAVAVAAAEAWRQRGQTAPERLLAAVVARTPAGVTRDGLVRALGLPAETTVAEAATLLGNGSRATAPDTVPFALWCAERHRDDYPAALWAAVAAGGDVDTIAAIMGGVVAVTAGRTIPQTWLAAREPLDVGGSEAGRRG